MLTLHVEYVFTYSCDAATRAWITYSVWSTLYMTWTRTYSRWMYSQNRLNLNRIPYFLLRSAYSTRRMLTPWWSLPCGPCACPYSTRWWGSRGRPAGWAPYQRWARQSPRCRPGKLRSGSEKMNMYTYIYRERTIYIYREMAVTTLPPGQATLRICENEHVYVYVHKENDIYRERWPSPRCVCLWIRIRICI